ncbi:MAG: transglutaminase domain-containing protein [Clostridiales bacterium]|nr:transglutaminase domain-containing protein [Clostridiales bacterium]
MRRFGMKAGAFTLALVLSLSGVFSLPGTSALKGAPQTLTVYAAEVDGQGTERESEQKRRDLAYLESQGVILVENNAAMKKDLVKRMKNHEKQMTYYYDDAKSDYKEWVDTFLNGTEKQKTKIYGEIGGMIRTYDEYVAGNAYSRGLGYMTYGDYYCISFMFGYYTTKAQDKKVDAEAKKLAKKYKNKTTYQKIKLTHDYLKNKITYTANYDGAYNALIKGKSVCNGYALSFQRIMQEMDIPCKYVTGTGQGGPHAWNLVKIGRNWYNMDVTWDDMARTSAYFLKSDKDFKDHVREYEDQYSGLKLAAKSYKK